MPHWKSAKTKKAVSKRFKITGTGKVIAYGAGRRHLMAGKSAKRRRGMRQPHAIGATDTYRIKQNLPFGLK